MAIDTRNKRASAINVGLPWRCSFPMPDGSISQADRKHVSLLYAGILDGIVSIIETRGRVVELLGGGGFLQLTGGGSFPHELTGGGGLVQVPFGGSQR